MVNIDTQQARIYISQMKIFHTSMNKKKIILQILFLFSASLMGGLGSNYLRSTPVPLIQDWSMEARLTAADGETMALALNQAIALYKNSGATFIDARDAIKFHEGHIKGALNLPWHDVQEQFMAVAPHLEPQGLIITYCDGGACNLSHDLALFLKEMGYAVKVMPGGWDAWLNADMPVSPTKGDDFNG